MNENQENCCRPHEPNIGPWGDLYAYYCSFDFAELHTWLDQISRFHWII